MLKSLLGIAPKQEQDGSYSPSKLALKLATSATTDYAPVPYERYSGKSKKVLVLFTEQKNMPMMNGRKFSTGNHPVEALVPMLHLQSAGFDFEIVTPTGKPAVLEMWAMPTQDATVMSMYDSLKPQLESPQPLSSIVDELEEKTDQYLAVFVPGGHGAMLGIPEDPNVGTLLRWAHDNELFTISICHGPGALLATNSGKNDFLYAGYEMAVFPDSVDKQTPIIGYLPGQMPWQLGARLQKLGVTIVNRKGDDTCCIDRKLITGASPAAADKLGQVAVNTLLEHLAQT
jgi:molecular chaperone Hsp31 and glyoxalase 3